MKIIILTQEDSFSIPQNIQKIICSVPGIEVSLIAVLDTSGALMNKKSYFAKGFGVVQTVEMGLLIGWVKVLNVLDRWMEGRLLTEKRSVSVVAQRNKIPFQRIKDPNHESFISRVLDLSPDVIVSFSAPVVFKERLLSLPKFGCLNLHCSYLPNYAGLLPSFWALFFDESQTGATVHYMDSRIDNGAIVEQRVVLIEKGMSMFDVIRKTKKVGGDLMCDVLTQMSAGKVLEHKLNNASAEHYFSWPTIEQMQEFRSRGGRLI